MKKMYFTEEEKKEAKKRWHHEDWIKHREQYMKKNNERFLKNKERYNNNRRKKYQTIKNNPIYRQKERDRKKKLTHEMRKKCIEHYSKGKNYCELCRITDMDVLTIDHINGGGNQHRREVGVSGEFYGWVIKNNYPEGYRILCMNCNMKQAKKQNLYGTKQFLK